LKLETAKDSSKVSLFESLFGGEYRRATWLNVGICAAYEMTGISTIKTFSNEIFDSNSFTMVIGVINLTGSMLSIFTINSFGRRTLLVFGFFGIAVTNVLMAIFHNQSNDNWMSISIILSFMVFTMTISPIQGIYATETCVDSSLGFVTMSLYLFRSATGYFIPALMLPYG